MTNDDVMALANQTAGQHWMDEAHIQRFAAFVAAAERFRILRVLEELDKAAGDRHNYYRYAINRIKEQT